MDPRRWRRLTADPELVHWERGDAWTFASAVPNVLAADCKRIETCVWKEPVPDAYRLEGVIRPITGRETPAFGLVFGSNARTGMQILAVLPKTESVDLFVLEDGPEAVEAFDVTFPADVDETGFALAVEVDGDHATFFLAGEKVGERDFQPGELRGRVGVFGQDVDAEFGELRIRY